MLATRTGRVEDALFRAHVYTDDPLFIVVGAARAVRALRHWRQVTQRFRLIMAIPANAGLEPWSSG